MIAVSKLHWRLLSYLLALFLVYQLYLVTDRVLFQTPPETDHLTVKEETPLESVHLIVPPYKEDPSKRLPESEEQDPAFKSTNFDPSVYQRKFRYLSLQSQQAKPKHKKLLKPAGCNSRGCSRIEPSFIIVGAQKSGTTSMFYYLSKHPQIIKLIEGTSAMGAKEIRFFDKITGYEPNIDDYMANFPTIEDLLAAGANADTVGRMVAGEASPNYIRYPDSPERISSMFPDMKLIFLLRNPIDRAYSHYQHAVRIDGEKKHYTGGHSFEMFISAEEKILETCKDLRLKWHLFSNCYRKESGKAAAVLNLPVKKTGRLTWMFQSMFRGLYAGQLINFARHFPMENILVVQSEEFYSNNAAVMERVGEFMAIDKFDWQNQLKAKEVFNFGAGNVVFETSHGTKYPPLDKNLRLRMEKFLAEFNADLYALFENDSFPHWEPSADEAQVN